ncbi:hypothetical protein EGW08_017910, partial [Elysia chlorotica]
MELRDLFTTARLVTLLVMASAATGLVQKQDLNVPSWHDSSSTSLKLLKRLYDRLGTIESKLAYRENGISQQIAVYSNAIQQHVLKAIKVHEEKLTGSTLLELLKRLDDRLGTMESKLASLENGFAGLRKDFTGSKRSAIDSNAHETSSTSLKLLKRLDDRLGTIEYKIASLENGFAKRSTIKVMLSKKMLKKKDLEEILTRIIRLTDSIEEGFSFLKDDVENSWQQLQLNTEESASKTQNAFQNVANKLNYTLSKKMQSALKQFFSPQS